MAPSVIRQKSEKISGDMEEFFSPRKKLKRASSLTNTGKQGEMPKDKVDEKCKAFDVLAGVERPQKFGCPYVGTAIAIPHPSSTRKSILLDKSVTRPSDETILAQYPTLCLAKRRLFEPLEYLQTKSGAVVIPQSPIKKKKSKVVASIINMVPSVK